MTSTQQKLAIAGGVVVGVGVLAYFLWPKGSPALPAKSFAMGESAMTLKVGQKLPITLPPGDAAFTRTYSVVSDHPEIANVVSPSGASGGTATITAVAPGQALLGIRLYEHGQTGGKTISSTMDMRISVTVIP